METIKTGIASPENLELLVDELNERRKINFGNVGALLVCGVITQDEYKDICTRINEKYDSMIAQSKAMATKIKH